MTDSPKRFWPERAAGHAVALGTATLFTIALTWLYVGSERTYYFWDQAVFERLGTRTALAFQGSFWDGVAVLKETAREDYNALFALPLMPFVWALGETRLAFELGIALAYVLPLALTLGSIAAEFIRGPKAAVFWSTTALALLTPMSWIPGFRGYPDAGAALLVALALRLLVVDPALRRPRTIVGAGALLAGAVLFRRHFLFAAPALFAGVAVAAVVRARAQGEAPRQALTGLVSIAVRIVLAAAAGFAAAFALARPVVLRLMGHDFYELYAGYLNPPGAVVSFFLPQYGALVWLGAIVGFVVGWRTGLLDPDRALLVAAAGAAGLLQWVVVVRQVGEQYTLHFTPTLVLGLAALGWILWTRLPRTRHRLLGYAMTFYLVFNLLCGLSTAPFAYEAWFFRPLLAANWAPLERLDYDEIRNLISHLRGLAKSEDPLFVAASSMTLNPDLLRNAERALHGREPHLTVLRTPAVDSRDQYPLEALLRARYVVLVSPLQLHLPADEQKVVAVVHEMFEERAAMARDFEELEGRFPVGPNVVRVARRLRPSSIETGRATLRYIQARFQESPGSQPDWAVVSEVFPSELLRLADGATRFTWHPARAGDVPPPVAAYLGEVPENAHATGIFRFVDPRCLGATAIFSFLDADGSIHDAAEVSRRPGEPEAFEAAFPSRPGSRLLLRLTPQPGQASIDFCLLQIDRLVLR